MGRNYKEGLDYFRLSVDYGHDDAIELIDGEFGAKGYRIITKLIQRIYKNKGYYIEWNEKRKLLFANSVGEPGGLVDEIITRSFKWGLFDESVFTQLGILTSSDIQKTYLDAAKRREKVEIIRDYSLCDISAFINCIYVNRNPINDTENEQSRVEKSREEKSKKENSAPAPPAPKKKSLKKQEDKPEEHWQPMVDAYFEFIKKNYPGEEPSFTGRDPKSFKDLVQLLKKRAGKKNLEWNQANAVSAMNYYLQLAHSETWLQQHFLLKNLVEQFDAVYQRAIQSKPGKDKKAVHTDSDVRASKVNRELTYLKERFQEGNLDDRILTGDIYSNLERYKLVPEGYLQKFPGETLDEKSRAAIREWLRLQSEPA
jgi:hypothetical protein